jgi:hypothetical protein
MYLWFTRRRKDAASHHRARKNRSQPSQRRCSEDFHYAIVDFILFFRRVGKVGLGQIDTAIEEAAKRGRTSASLSAIAEQRKAREPLSWQRQREAAALADLKTERAVLTAKVETEAAPIRYVAELIGASRDSERAIRWLIALMVLCCDPLAIALTAAASARRQP